MLVNIWATLVHMGDRSFCGADNQTTEDLSLLISEGLRRRTRGKQTWMVDPHWLSPGTTGRLLQESYRALTGAHESYLMLVTPGFSDVLHGVPASLVKRQLEVLVGRAEIFGKKTIAVALGIPPKTPSSIARKIKELNDAYTSVTRAHGGVVADLRKLKYRPWGPQGSFPERISRVADAIVRAVLASHTS